MHLITVNYGNKCHKPPQRKWYGAEDEDGIYEDFNAYVVEEPVEGIQKWG